MERTVIIANDTEGKRKKNFFDKTTAAAMAADHSEIFFLGNSIAVEFLACLPAFLL